MIRLIALTATLALLGLQGKVQVCRELGAWELEGAIPGSLRPYSLPARQGSEATQVELPRTAGSPAKSAWNLSDARVARGFPVGT